VFRVVKMGGVVILKKDEKQNGGDQTYMMMMRTRKRLRRGVERMKGDRRNKTKAGYFSRREKVEYGERAEET
jgi:hypothetical protein